MTHIHRSALLPYSNEQLFDLVNDVSAYPQYMDGCVDAQVLSCDAQSMTARLHLKKGGVSQSFATRNQLHKPEKITLQLLEGPFEELHGEWCFKALAANACKVSLSLDFRMQSSIAHKAGEKIFESVAGNLVNAVCQRAKVLYGSSHA